MLVTLSIVAVMVGVGMTTYRNLQRQAQETAQNRDQVVLKQVVDSFRMTGGNMQALLANSSLANSPSQMAAALTRVMQGTASAAARKQTGQISNLVSADMVIVPYSASDGLSRLAINADRTGLELRTTGAGFIVVKNDTLLGRQAVSAKPLAQQVAAAVLDPSSISGARYADAQDPATASGYIWNEDATTVSVSGGSSTTGGTTSTNVPGNVALVVRPAGQGDYTYYQYQGAGNNPSYDFYIYRADGKQLYREDFTPTVSNSLGVNVSVTPTSVIVPASITGSLGSVSGFLCRINNLTAIAKYDTSNYRSPQASNPIGVQYSLDVSAVSTPIGRLGRPGMGGLSASPAASSARIRVSAPTKLKAEYWFTNTVRNLSYPSYTRGYATAASGITTPQGQNTRSPLYLYHNYQFGSEPARNPGPDSQAQGATYAYIFVYRDFEGQNAAEVPTNKSAVALQDFTITLRYADRDFTISAKDEDGAVLVNGAHVMRLSTGSRPTVRGSLLRINLPVFQYKNGARVSSTAAGAQSFNLEAVSVRPTPRGKEGVIVGTNPSAWTESIIDIDYGSTTGPDRVPSAIVTVQAFPASIREYRTNILRTNPTYTEYIQDDQKFILYRSDARALPPADVTVSPAVFAGLPMVGGTSAVNVTLNSSGSTVINPNTGNTSAVQYAFNYSRTKPADSWTNSSENLRVDYAASPSATGTTNGVPSGGIYGDWDREGLLPAAGTVAATISANQSPLRAPSIALTLANGPAMRANDTMTITYPAQINNNWIIYGPPTSTSTSGAGMGDIFEPGTGVNPVNYRMK